METELIQKRMSDYLWYIIVAAISVCSLLFLPMLGTTAQLGWGFPATPTGWLVFIVSKFFVAALNVVIFHSFVQQARLNVRGDKYYQQALHILRKLDVKKHKPMSLQEFNRKQYRQKGIMTALTSLLSAFSLGQAVLTFDWISFTSYLFTIGIGILFGILEMKKYEDFYCTTFWEYAKYVEELSKEAEVASSEIEEDDDTVDNTGLVTVLEPAVDNGTPGIDSQP